MKSLGRRLGWSLVAVGLVGLLWFAVTRPPRVQFELPNGQVATFLGVTSGTNHVQPGRGWARLLRVLPGAVLTRLRLGELVDSATPLVMEEPCPVAWFALSGRLRSQAGEMASLDLMTVDGAGNELPETGSFRGLGIVGFAIDSFDRRMQILRMRLVYSVSGEQGTSIVRFPEITVPNPHLWTMGTFTPEPLPAVRRVEGVEVRLDRVVAKPMRLLGSGRMGTARLSWHRGHIEVFEENCPTRNWVPYAVEVLDATGNRMREPCASRGSPSTSEQGLSGRFEVGIGWDLPTTERAYKFIYTFRRAPGAPVRPGEEWWLRGVAVPSTAGLTQLNMSTNLNGAGVEILALVGAEASLPGRSHDVEGQAILEIRCRNLPTESDLGVSAWTPDGRELEHQWTEEGESYGFEIPEAVKAIDVRLSVVRRLQVEFTVRPEFLFEAEPAK